MRPDVSRSVKAEYSQHDVVSMLESNMSRLAMLVRFEFMFTEQSLIDLYSGNSQEYQKKNLPELYMCFSSRWQEFVYMMTRGYSVGYILTSSDGDAPHVWREQIGHWNIEASNEDITTLRGRYGLHNFNNLLHGSDSSGEALREVQILAKCIEASDYVAQYVSMPLTGALES